MSAAIKTVEVEISPGRTIRVEGLQCDRRRRNDLRITLADDRVLLAYGRKPEEEGWEVYFEDGSDAIVGTDLGTSVAELLGFRLAFDDPPDWLDRFMEAVS